MCCFVAKPSRVGLVIDGSSMLSTSYYGSLPIEFLKEKDPEKQKQYACKILQTSDGRYTNGLYHMLKKFMHLINIIEPDCVAIAFDDTRNTFRRTKLGADFYKSNRKETPSYLKEQFAYAKDFFKSIGVIVLSGPDYEADDYVASVTQLFKSECDTVYIHSKDHDFMQLVDDNVLFIRPVTAGSLATLRSYFGKQDYGFQNAYVYSKNVVIRDIGVSPERVCDYMAIAGDPGDGVPGCRGVKGAAVRLINHYDTIENLYVVIDEAIKNDALNELKLFWKNMLGISRSPLNALIECRDNVFLSKQLVTMVRDVMLPSYKISDYAYYWDAYAFADAAQVYEMKSFLMITSEDAVVKKTGGAV